MDIEEKKKLISIALKRRKRMHIIDIIVAFVMFIFTLFFFFIYDIINNQEDSINAVLLIIVSSLTFYLLIKKIKKYSRKVDKENFIIKLFLILIYRIIVVISFSISLYIIVSSYTTLNIDIYFYIKIILFPSLVMLIQNSENNRNMMLSSIKRFIDSEIKSKNYKRVALTLNSVINVLKNNSSKNDKRVNIKDGTSIYKVLLSDIVYIKSDGRLKHFFLQKSYKKTSNKLSANYDNWDLVLKELDNRFLLINRSVVINKNHVVSKTKDGIFVRIGTDKQDIELKVTNKESLKKI